MRLSSVLFQIYCVVNIRYFQKETEATTSNFIKGGQSFVLFFIELYKTYLPTLGLLLCLEPFLKAISGG